MSCGSTTSGTLFQTSLANASSIAADANGQLIPGSGGGGAATIVTNFTTSGTWTINPNTVFVDIYAWGGGAGGGGGQTDIITNSIAGGNGGGQGYFVYQRFLKSAFTSPVAITVGAGGSGGAGGLIGGGNGADGTDGNDTIIPLNVGQLTAFGGTGGSGGSPSLFYQQANALSSNNSFTNPLIGFQTPFFNLGDPISGTGIASSGGFGGYYLGAFADGLAGGDIQIGSNGIGGQIGKKQILLAGGTFSAADGASGGNGSDGGSIPWMSGGTGGGGGQVSILTNGGNGGDGGLRGASGGGGGAAITGVGAGGNGGNGSRGEVIIVEYLSGASSPTFSSCFLVAITGITGSVTGDGTGYDVLFDTVVFDNNSNITLNSGGKTIFTAPATGIYEFNYTLTFYGNFASPITSTSSAIGLITTSSNYFSGYENPSTVVSSVGPYLTYTWSGIASLTIGDIASINVNLGGGALNVALYGQAGGNYFTTWSGKQIA